ncbi:MAG: sigma-54-dependent Fis family transcriptional regulator [Colwellia sp.]|nr:sigma-54-dependent Fis family transcriptional regulator [Colwellia sp.]
MVNAFLIVDDDESDRNNLKDILEEEFNDATLLTAKDGNEALNILKERLGKIDVIITDEKMDGINGLDLIKKIKLEQSWPPIHIFLATLYSNLDLAVNAARLGINDYIKKPIQKHDIIKKIKKCIEDNKTKENIKKEIEINELTIGPSFLVVNNVKVKGKRINEILESKFSNSLCKSVRNYKDAVVELKEKKGCFYNVIISVSNSELIKEVKETFNIPLVFIACSDQEVFQATKNNIDYIHKNSLTCEIIAQKINTYIKKAKLEGSTIVGKSEGLRKVYGQIRNVLDKDTSLVIQGENGTGKELIAEEIHYNSIRKKKPLIKIGLSALNENLVESELFGHEKGAFANAYKQKKGRFELANGGTLHIQDIEDASLMIQEKLLRVLQKGQFERVGGEDTIIVDVRLICDTKKDLAELVNLGMFREDLYHRLNVITITIPPLRERKEDIPLLTNYSIKEISEHLKIPEPDISEEALDVLMKYNWPGNVRELKNVVEHALLFCNKNIEPYHLPDRIKSEKPLNNVKNKDEKQNTTSANPEHITFDKDKCIDNFEEKEINRLTGLLRERLNNFTILNSEMTKELAKYLLKEYTIKNKNIRKIIHNNSPNVMYEISYLRAKAGEILVDMLNKGIILGKNSNGKIFKKEQIIKKNTIKMYCFNENIMKYH